MATEAKIPSQEDLYISFKSLKKEAHNLIENGKELEKVCRKQDALLSFESGLNYIERALGLHIVCDSNPHWDNYFTEVTELRTIRKEIAVHLEELNRSPYPDLGQLSEPPPPSYEEATGRPSSLQIEKPSTSQPSTSRSPSIDVKYTAPSAPASEDVVSISSSTDLDYSSLCRRLSQIRMDSIDEEADIIFVQEYVRSYSITPQGISSSSDLMPLMITRGKANGVYLLKFGSLVYPLVPGKTPVLPTIDYRTFVIPDMRFSEPGHAIGLVLPDGDDGCLYHNLQEILQGMPKLEDVVPPPRKPSSSMRGKRGRKDRSIRVPRGVVNAAEFLSTGVEKGAEAAGSFLDRGTEKIQNQIETPTTRRKPKHRSLIKSLKYARNVTKAARTASSTIASKANAATFTINKFANEDTETHDAGTYSASRTSSRDSAASVVEAEESLPVLYNELEKSASILAQQLAKK